jgi:hypothetical protein
MSSRNLIFFFFIKIILLISSVVYTKYIKPNTVNEENKKRIENYIEKSEDEQIQIQTVIKFGEVFLDLNPDNYEKRYKKFVSELSILLDNMKLANVF